MKTKARGIHANFAVDCPRCDGEFTISNGRIDPHDCREPGRPVSLADIRAALSK